MAWSCVLRSDLTLLSPPVARQDTVDDLFHQFKYFDLIFLETNIPKRCCALLFQIVLGLQLPIILGPPSLVLLFVLYDKWQCLCCGDPDWVTQLVDHLRLIVQRYTKEDNMRHDLHLLLL